MSRRTIAGQGIRYIGVGFLNVGVGLAAFWLLDLIWGTVLDVQVIYWISAIIGIVNGFIWQRVFVWRSKGAWRHEFARFFAFNLVVSVVNSLLLFVAVTLCGLPAFPSQVVITGVLVIVAFIVNRTWVFRVHPGGRNRRTSPSADATPHIR